MQRSRTRSRFIRTPFVLVQSSLNVAKLVLLYKSLAACLLILATASTASAAFEIGPETSRRIVLSPRSLSFAHIEGLWYNPAWISRLRNFGGCAGYSPGMFGLRELSSASLGATMPTGFGTAGIALVTSGFDAYREVSLGAVWSTTVTDQFSAGGRLNLHRLDISNYGGATAWSLDAGVTGEMIPQVTLSAYARNIFGNSIGRSSEPLPREFSLGLVWSPGGLQIGVGADSDVRFPVSLRCALEYAVLDAFTLNGGVASGPSEFTLGGTARIGAFEVRYSALVHPELGVTHFFGLSFGVDG